VKLYAQPLALTRFFRNLLMTRVAVKTGFRIDPKPLILIWESTNRCNAKCEYCDFWRQGPADDDLLDGAEIRDLIDQAAALGVCCFSISGGGEPLLREDMGRNIEYCKKKGLAVAVTTNGLLIDEQRAQELLKADVVTVSVDSLDEAKNNKRRGSPDYFRKSLQGIKLLTRNNKNTYLCVQSVLDEENWKEINEINNYFYAMGVDTLFQPRYNHAFGIRADEWRQRVRKLKYRNILSRKLLKRFMEQFPRIADGSWQGRCLAGSVAVVVSARGELSACHLNKCFSQDLRNKSLQAALSDMRPIRAQLLEPDRNCTCGDTAIVPYSMLVV
jgi:MoaA/NifB/PqqE/SkfB family radical SAM enzyme